MGLKPTGGIRKSNPWQLNTDQDLSRPFSPRDRWAGLHRADFRPPLYLPALSKTYPSFISFFPFFLAPKSSDSVTVNLHADIFSESCKESLLWCIHAKSVAEEQICFLRHFFYTPFFILQFFKVVKSDITSPEIYSHENGFRHAYL